MKTALASALVALALVAAPARAESPSLTLLPTQLTLGVAPLQPAFLLGQADVAQASAEVKRTTLFGLPQNVGTVDRVVRGVVAAGLIGFGAYQLAKDDPNKTLGGVLLGVSAVPAATGASGYCPLYQLLGIDTNF